MSLQDKIKKIINVIENTNIEEIEISSFWGAQKIRLSKKTSVDQSNASINSNHSENKQTSSDNTIVVENLPKENKPEDNQSACHSHSWDPSASEVLMR